MGELEYPFSAAEFSECGKYRHWLLRVWEPSMSGKIMGCIIGKNPSTAGKENNDQTMHKDIAFGKLWGWRGILKVNLFDWIATDANDLLRVSDSLAVSPQGLIGKVIAQIQREECGQVVCAWGTHVNKSLAKRFKERGENMKRQLHAAGFETYALKINKDGTPAHTLYLPSDLKPILWQ